MLTSAACASSGGVFHGGACEPNPCPQPPAPGSGDTVADPFIAPGFGTYTGTTVGFHDDYDEVCPYSGSTSPDVVYAYTPAAGVMAITIDLCYSSYDTKVYVYDTVVTPGAPLACNDDYYFAAPCYTYSSFVGPVAVQQGHFYYIVIDGYFGASGTYQMDLFDAIAPAPIGACCAASGVCTVTTEVGCAGVFQGVGTSCSPNPCPAAPPVVCPPGSLLEVEDNGGCNSTPPVFQPLDPQAAGCATMCGTGWATANSRDTDWFVSIGTGGLMTGTATAEFPLQYILIYGTDCAAPAYVLGTGEPGVPVTLSWTVTEGAEVWNWIGCSDFANWPESDYVLDVCGIESPPSPPGACCQNGQCSVVSQETCTSSGGVFYGAGTLCTPSPCESVPTLTTSWGAIKAWFLDPSVPPEGVPGRSGSGERAGITPKPVAATRSSGGSPPALFGTKPPPKGTGAGVKGGK
jgi:hypothetical protein